MNNTNSNHGKFLLIQLSLDPNLPIPIQLRAASGMYQKATGHWPDLIRLNPGWMEHDTEIKKLSIPIDYHHSIQLPTAWIGTNYPGGNN